MLVLKSGIVAKFALVAMGVLLGVGGVATGSRLGTLRAHPENRRVIAAQILSVEHRPGVKVTLLRVETRSGLIVTVAVTPTTTVKYKGTPLPTAELTVGTRFIGVVRNYRDGVVTMASMTVTRLGAHPAQAP